jgi:hypothetical protein
VVVLAAPQLRAAAAALDDRGGWLNPDIANWFAPIADANVVLVLGTGFTAALRSGADGAFRFDKVPAGAAGQLLISKDGFGTVRVQVSVPGSAGNVPLNDGNANAGVILLLELNGSVRYQLQTANGRPARGARALLEVSPAGFQLFNREGFGDPQGQLSFEGQADDTGTLTFMNVPAPAELARTSNSTNYTLIVGGLDEDGDGDNEFNGLIDQRSGRSFFIGGVPTLRLPDSRTLRRARRSAASRRRAACRRTRRRRRCPADKRCRSPRCRRP